MFVLCCALLCLKLEPATGYQAQGKGKGALLLCVLHVCFVAACVCSCLLSASRAYVCLAHTMMIHLCQVLFHLVIVFVACASFGCCSLLCLNLEPATGYHAQGKGRELCCFVLFFA